MVELKRSFRVQLLEEEIMNIDPPITRIQRKEVFIILDDPGIKILATNRDKQALENMVDEIYEVERLNHHKAFHLFELKVFENYNIIIILRDLLERKSR
ncbi:unnamed protein product, partial [Dovyalis caffra]